MRIRKRREVKSGIKKVGEISFSVGIKVYRGKLEEERQSERDKIENSVVKAQELNSWEDTCLWA